MLEKEKLLMTSNFSFSHSVFKRLVLQGLFGKGFTDGKMIVTQDLKFVFGGVEDIARKL